MGRVTDPVYSVRFNTASEIDRALFAVGTPVFSVLSEAVPVFMDRARQKGTDASNLYDEELPEEVRPPLTCELPDKARVLIRDGRGAAPMCRSKSFRTTRRRPRINVKTSIGTLGRTRTGEDVGPDPMAVRALTDMAADPRASGWPSTHRRRTLRRMGALRRRQLARA